MGKVYCGVNKLKKGQRLGTSKECVEQKQIRLYGLNKIDLKTLGDVKDRDYKQSKETLFKLLMKAKGNRNRFKGRFDALVKKEKRKKLTDEEMDKKKEYKKLLNVAEKSIDVLTPKIRKLLKGEDSGADIKIKSPVKKEPKKKSVKKTPVKKIPSFDKKLMMDLMKLRGELNRHKRIVADFEYEVSVEKEVLTKAQKKEEAKSKKKIISIQKEIDELTDKIKKGATKKASKKPAAEKVVKDAKVKKVKKDDDKPPRKKNRWIEFVKEYKTKFPDMKYKDILKKAAESKEWGKYKKTH